MNLKVLPPLKMYEFPLKRSAVVNLDWVLSLSLLFHAGSFEVFRTDQSLLKLHSFGVFYPTKVKFNIRQIDCIY